jgi:hypothetical protein
VLDQPVVERGEFPLSKSVLLDPSSGGLAILTKIVDFIGEINN